RKPTNFRKAFKLTLSVGFLFAVDTFTSFLRPVLTGIVWRVMSQTRDCLARDES
ncbi:hypothetical protein LTSESEN_2763, partial [Salmonella enterica subsp. enterica serovar Senftenberg str. A4-543]